MNVDAILRTLNDAQVDCLLIGGMNFLLRHRPELTFDVDIWVRDDTANLQRLNCALRELCAAWGPTENQWKPVPGDWRWLQDQPVFCLTTQHGALDVFRDVRGLESRYTQCRERAVSAATGTGVKFLALSDKDMLTCQEALPPHERNHRRMEVLREAIRCAEPSDQ